ncbi:hypothetical protein V6N13_041429 [Hibiscus sabdariffa]
MVFVLLTSSDIFRALLLTLSAVWLLSDLALAKHAGITRHYKFDIKMQSVTKLCQTKSIVTVNGQFPGPRIIAREGDRLLIKPYKEVPIVFGEWWKADTETIINQAMATGGAPNISDAFTINGLPGPSYNCSAKEYEKSVSASKSNNKKLPLLRAKLPQFNDSNYAMKFNRKIRSLATAKFPAKIPKKVDRRFFFTVGLGILPCSKSQTCQGPNNTRPAAAVNNVSFLQPNIALLQAHFFNKSKGVYTTNFPTNPPFKFNYTGTPPKNIALSSGTKVVALPFNTSVELVLQDTSILGAESHPLHLHGFNFFVLAQGIGNFNPKDDPAKFNLVDPAERNTVGVPSGGWVAIRFLADNPGVWFMHCHLEVHTSWGLKMAWVVNDGKGRKQKLPPPPTDLPKC